MGNYLQRKMGTMNAFTKILNSRFILASLLVSTTALSLGACSKEATNPIEPNQSSSVKDTSSTTSEFSVDAELLGTWASSTDTLILKEDRAIISGKGVIFAASDEFFFAEDGNIGTAEAGQNPDDQADYFYQLEGDTIWLMNSALGNFDKTKSTKLVLTIKTEPTSSSSSISSTIIDNSSSSVVDPSSSSLSSSSISSSGEILIDSSSFVDARDGEVYKAVKIGDQTWMAENLRYKIEGKSWCLKDLPFYCVYGSMYDWNTLLQSSSPSSLNPSGVQGVCPADWHIPSRAEWDQLGQNVADIIGKGTFSEARWSEVGRHLKSIDAWSGVGGGIDSFGFKAMPFGYRLEKSPIEIYHEGEAIFWTASEKNSTEGYGFGFDGGFAHMTRDYMPKEAGVFLRCVKN